MKIGWSVVYIFSNKPNNFRSVN